MHKLFNSVPNIQVLDVDEKKFQNQDLVVIGVNCIWRFSPTMSQRVDDTMEACRNSAFDRLCSAKETEA